MAKKAVSQSRTMWVKKGDIVGGKKVQKGYLAQYGKPEKRVSANVRMVTELGTRTYKQGRRVNKPMAVGGGNAPGSRKDSTTTTGGTNSRPSYVGKPGPRTKNYQTGEGMTVRGSTRVNPWPAVDRRVELLRRKNAGSSGSTGPSQQSPTRRPVGTGTDRLGPQGKVSMLRLALARKKQQLAAAKARKAQTAADRAAQARMERELKALQSQLDALK